MNNVFGLVGYACNGKSTLLNRLKNNDNYEVIDLPKIYRQLAYSHGFTGVTEYFSNVGLEKYKEETEKEVLRYLDSLEKTNKDIIFDDIFDKVIYNAILSKYPNIKIISFESDYEDRLKRLSKRTGMADIEELKIGLKKRDEMKEYCGIKDILKDAKSNVYNHGNIDDVYNRLMSILNKSLIICITGLSGSGKSTVVSYLKEYYNLPVFYYGKKATEATRRNGYQKNRYYLENEGIESYKKMLDAEVYERIEKFKEQHKIFIIDGIFYYSMYEKIKSLNDVYNICISLDEKTRIERLSHRENLDLSEAPRELLQKDYVKIQCGALQIMEDANYTFINDGKHDKEEIHKQLLLK